MTLALWLVALLFQPTRNSFLADQLLHFDEKCRVDETSVDSVPWCPQLFESSENNFVLSFRCSPEADFAPNLLTWLVERLRRLDHRAR